MKQCAQCGSQVTGAFCPECGASWSEDGVPTRGPVAPGGENTWHEEPTQIREQPATPYPGYQPQSYNPGGYPSAGYASGAAAHTGSVPMGSPSKSRSNILLASLVALAALVVTGLVGYLVLRPGAPKTAVAPTPSTSPSSPTSKESAPANTQLPQNGTPAPSGVRQQVPANGSSQPVMNTPSNTAPAQLNSAAAPQPVQTQAPSGNTAPITKGEGATTSGDFTATASGSSVVVTGPGINSTLSLNGYRADGLQGQYLKWATLPGCNSPILVWNAGQSTGSAAFGSDGAGGYQAFASDGTYDLSPTGGDGSNTHEYGVYVEDGVIAFNDQNKGRANYNVFDSCDGNNLHYARKGL